jgi:pyrroline-5-carboxylate reductase
MNKKIGVIGTGNMGSAIIYGALKSKVFTKNDILAYEINKDLQSHIEDSTGIQFTSYLKDLAHCDLIVIAVKPQDIKDLLNILGKYINEDSLIVSIAAGVALSSLKTHLNNKGHIIRAMPNTPVSICVGVTAICIDEKCSNIDISQVENLFNSLGTTIQIKENMFDSISALSGSGPAYFFYIIEALVKVAIQEGFDEKTALKLMIQTCSGAIKLLQSTDKSPEELLQKVMSPKGSTAEAIKIFEKEHMPQIIKNAIKSAIQRNKELGETNN